MLRILFRVRLKSDLNSLWISRCAKYSMSFTQNTSSFLRKKSFVVFVLLQQRKIWNLWFFVLIENRFKSFPSGNLRRKSTQNENKKRRKWKFPVHLRLLFHHINFHAAKRVEIYFFDSKKQVWFLWITLLKKHDRVNTIVFHFPSTYKSRSATKSTR